MNVSEEIHHVWTFFSGSIAGGTIADLKDHPIERAERAKISGDTSPDAEQDEFQQRLQQIEKVGTKHDEFEQQLE